MAAVEVPVPVTLSALVCTPPTKVEVEVLETMRLVAVVVPAESVEEKAPVPPVTAPMVSLFANKSEVDAVVAKNAVDVPALMVRLPSVVRPVTLRVPESAVLPTITRLPVVVAFPETVSPPVAVPSPIVVDASESNPAEKILVPVNVLVVYVFGSVDELCAQISDA